MESIVQFQDDEPDTTEIASRSVIRKTLDRQRRAQTPYLVVVSSETAVGKMFKINERVVIGRAPDSDVRLDEDGVSRKHARLTMRVDGAVEVQDLKSTNGTYVNGDRVERMVLRDGDKLQVGPITILKFSYDALDEELQKNLYESATKDPLTELANRKAFAEALDREVSFAQRHKRPLALVAFDIDHFKKINDTHGHPAGDHVLQCVAYIVKSELRNEDLLARVGGEEFSILMRDTTAANARICAERVRARIESAAITYRDKAIPVTISLGVALLRDGIPDLIRTADASLYKAKHFGRNRVES
jgi:diguanylate cyclase (GGDEF)-like protein